MYKPQQKIQSPRAQFVERRFLKRHLPLTPEEDRWVEAAVDRVILHHLCRRVDIDRVAEMVDHAYDAAREAVTYRRTVREWRTLQKSS